MQVNTISSNNFAYNNKKNIQKSQPAFGAQVKIDLSTEILGSKVAKDILNAVPGLKNLFDDAVLFELSAKKVFFGLGKKLVIYCERTFPAEPPTGLFKSFRKGQETSLAAQNSMYKSNILSHKDIVKFAEDIHNSSDEIMSSTIVRQARDLANS